jgi:hypothetical protein
VSSSDVVLETISASYEAQLGGTIAQRQKHLDELFRRYFDGRIRPLAEALACGAAISALWSGRSFDPTRLDEQQLEAFRLAFPRLNVDQVSGYSGEALDGLLTAWKGKLFEVKVCDSLNSGEWVGDWHLSAGQKAVLAESPTQAGWDLAILEADGTIAEQIQLKSTNFISYVEAAESRYPDIPIIATSEVRGALSPQSDISVSDISDIGLEQELIDVAATGLTDSIWGVVLPGLPLALNLYWVAKGNRTPEQAARAATASTAAIATAAAANYLIDDLIVDVVLDGVVGLGVGFLARKLFGWLFTGDDEVQRMPKKVTNRAAFARRFDRAAQHVKTLGTIYPPSPALSA